MLFWMEGWTDGRMNQWIDDRWMDVRMDGETNGFFNLPAKTASTEAINYTATSISTLPNIAVTSAYATAKAGLLLAK